MRKSRKISVSLPANVVDELDSLSLHMGVTRSALIALFLEGSLQAAGAFLSNANIEECSDGVRRLRGDSITPLRGLVNNVIKEGEELLEAIAEGESQSDLFKE